MQHQDVVRVHIRPSKHTAVGHRRPVKHAALSLRQKGHWQWSPLARCKMLAKNGPTRERLIALHNVCVGMLVAGVHVSSRCKSLHVIGRCKSMHASMSCSDIAHSAMHYLCLLSRSLSSDVQSCRPDQLCTESIRIPNKLYNFLLAFLN